MTKFTNPITGRKLMFAAALIAVLASGATDPVDAAVGKVGCGEPAGGKFQAGQRLGGYWGQQLPNSYRYLRTEAQVNRAITRQSNRAGWDCFDSFYSGAVHKWKENTKRL